MNIGDRVYAFDDVAQDIVTTKIIEDGKVIDTVDVIGEIVNIVNGVPHIALVTYPNTITTEAYELVYPVGAGPVWAIIMQNEDEYDLA